jgi:anti-sigma-K factor RskA
LSLAVSALAIAGVVVLQREVANLQQEVTSLEQGLLAQARSIEELNIKQSQVNASTVKTISLSGTEAQPQAYAQLIADPDSPSAVLVVAGLAPPPAGKVHQVWLIQGNSPISAGFLSVDAGGQGVLLLESDQPIGSFDALGVSIEPEGGNPEPKGDIVILGNL